MKIGLGGKVVWVAILAALVLVLLAGVVLAQALVTGTVTRNANLRAGPGTSYAVVGTATAGAAVVIVGENAAGDWYELEDGQWIAAFLVTTGNAVPPVATTRPTAVATAQPSARPTAAATMQEWQRYSSQTLGSLQDLSGAMARGGDLLSNPQMASSTWVTQVAMEFVVIRQAHEKLRAMRPPASLAWLHTRLLAATGDCNEATYAISDGFDNVNVAEMERGAALIISCGTQLGELADTLSEIQASMTPTPRATPTRRP